MLDRAGPAQRMAVQCPGLVYIPDELTEKYCAEFEDGSHGFRAR